MHMSKERIEFGNALLTELERLLRNLDPTTTRLNLEKTIEYMEHIRAKMIAHYYWHGEDQETLAQIARMQKCINYVREQLKQKDATAM